MTMPGMCGECGHANAVHSSQGCLWSVTGLDCHCALDRDREQT